ncbi:hypothetical protein [Oceanisphaera psychrotolerans]|uniref:hypothetical protein n=1 Tax=Oceanisphaera psychrotolerans TaxID=1414654 RepID=UPI0011136F0F|nr:hypothetical protein [Oceanisphaera psychrotolerans]
MNLPAMLGEQGVDMATADITATGQTHPYMLHPPPGYHRPRGSLISFRYLYEIYIPLSTGSEMFACKCDVTRIYQSILLIAFPPRLPVDINLFIYHKLVLNLRAETAGIRVMQMKQQAGKHCKSIMSSVARRHSG